MHLCTRSHKPILIQLLENSESIRIIRPPLQNIRTSIPRRDLNMPKNFFREFEDLFLEVLEENLEKLFLNLLVDNTSNLDQEGVQLSQVQKPIDSNKAKREEPLSISINPLVQLMDLTIQIPKRLSAAPMPSNLLIFKDIRNEDPLAHIECFIKTHTMYLITYGHYYLV